MKKKYVEKKILPRTPSTLIRLALADLGAAEQRHDRFSIDMGTWHTPTEVGTCEVCFAGAVMARSLHVPDAASVSPADFPKNQGQLAALNRLREGAIESALQHLGIVSLANARPANRHIPDYWRHRGRFKSAMRKLADEFEAFGL